MVWYKNAIIYSVNVESYMDGNGDGIGDFKGLARRLDHIHGIGVGAIWLLPFQSSPRQDHGYDVSDYYSVDPRFGTLGDFVEFTDQCAQRGIRVMMDLVFNHTSDQHPWFQESRSSPDNPKRDWYMWSKEKPENIHEGMVFPGKQEAVWTYDKKARAWYFHRFHKFQPDLNMKNPEVQAEILRIMGFWLRLGVSGFRLDAVPFIIATDEHEEAGGTEREFALLRKMREFSQFRDGDSVLLAEANVKPEASIEYFGPSAERLHMMFNFWVNPRIFYAFATGDAGPLKEGLEKTREIPQSSQWAQFLRNHDELDLSRLTEEQRQKVYDEMAPDEGMRVFDRGIRRRLGPMLKGDQRRIKAANSLLMSLPGTPVLRYGDEIGMGENLDLEGRTAIRTPMQWDEHGQGGFTTAEEACIPLIEHGPYGFHEVNVSQQRRDPESLLNWFERIIRLRQELPEIGYGAFRIIETEPEILAMCHEWEGSAILTVHNFDGQPRQVEFRINEDEQEKPPLINLLSNDHVQPQADGMYRFVIDPYGYNWFRCGATSVGLARKD
ncbi:alpha-amylase family protein [Altericroceibacterium xinjiangense]|uniref:alpha-amylase family protein n=1 Tax=Altericroceibacterium xinjiangense TaxID=762261 RepID=UPI0019D2DA8F|nr:alpha-amylase family protein [Altericroceibacterium xinjiangense]